MKNWKWPFLAAFTAFLSIQATAQNSSNFDEYGGKIGIGITILDGFGVPVRYYKSPKKVFEVGLYAGGVAEIRQNVAGDDEITVHSNLMPGIGATFFGNRFEKSKRKKVKVRAHGVALRFNYLLGNRSTAIPEIGWAMETFRKGRTKRSFIFELGAKGLISTNDLLDNGAGAYLRCHWNFFIR